MLLKNHLLYLTKLKRNRSEVQQRKVLEHEGVDWKRVLAVDWKRKRDRKKITLVLLAVVHRSVLEQCTASAFTK